MAIDLAAMAERNARELAQRQLNREAIRKGTALEGSYVAPQSARDVQTRLGQGLGALSQSEYANYAQQGQDMAARNAQILADRQQARTALRTGTPIEGTEQTPYRAPAKGVAAIADAMPALVGQTSPLTTKSAAASPYSFQESRAFGGKTYENLDPEAVKNVKAQLAAQQKAMDPKYWQGNVDLDRMASNLVASGVTDIRQVGKGKAEVGRQSVTKGPDGFYKMSGGGGEDGAMTRLTPEEEKQVKEANGVYYVPTLGDAIVNKTTGERLKSGYGDRTTGNMWSGTYEGKGNTGYGVQFDDKGNPYFYTAPASSSDAKEWLTPLMIAGSFFLPGITQGLSTALSGATSGALTPAVSSALTNGLISGGVNSLAGGDFWKGALTGGLTSFAAPYVGQGIKALGIENSIINNMAQGAASSGVKSLLSGRDVGDSLLSGALSGAAGGAAKEYAPDSPMLQQGIKLIPSLIQGGSLNPMQLALAAAQGMK